MAEKVKSLGGEIILHSTVTKINVEAGKVISVVATNQEGKETEYAGDYFISSMPIKDLVEAIGKEKVPEDTYRVATSLPYRDFITVGLLVDKLKVVNKTKIKTLGDIVPDCWIYVQDRDVRLGRIQIFNNWSPYMVDDPANKVWIGLEYFCSEGDAMWTCPDQEFIQKAIGELVKIGVVESEKNIMDSTIIHVKKAYPAYFGTYAEFDKVRAYLDTLSNLYPVGRTGQHRYNNMDHSMVTSMVAAEKIVSGDPDKTALWNVNTEKSYHEIKDEEKDTTKAKTKGEAIS
jgi:hypothetical protein